MIHQHSMQDTTLLKSAWTTVTLLADYLVGMQLRRSFGDNASIDAAGKSNKGLWSTVSQGCAWA